MSVVTLPEHWSKFLLAQPETGMDYQIITVTLRDGRVFGNVAVVHHSVLAEVHGHAEIPFDPADIAHIEVTHEKWIFVLNAEMKTNRAIAFRGLSLSHSRGGESPSQRSIR